MELTQEQVNRIVEVAEEYQIELEAAAKRFRRRLGEVGLPLGPAGRLVVQERYYRPEPAKMPRITFVGGLDGVALVDVLDDTDEERGH